MILTHSLYTVTAFVSEESLTNAFPSIATSDAQATDGVGRIQKQILVALLGMLNSNELKDEFQSGGGGERLTSMRLCYCPPYPLYRV